MKEIIYITQTVTYNHSIKIETEDNDSDDLISFLNSHGADQYYGNLDEIITEIADAGFGILKTEEDGSGECEWTFE